MKKLLSILVAGFMAGGVLAHPTAVDRTAGGGKDWNGAKHGSHWEHGKHGARSCPPGLAKKRNGCMPPGQAKKEDTSVLGGPGRGDRQGWGDRDGRR